MSPEFKDWIESAFRLIKEEMVLEFVRISFSTISKSFHSDEGEVVFSTTHSTRYHRATFHIYPLAVKLFNENRKEELISLICHELSHLHTTNMGDIAKKRFLVFSELEEGVEKVTDIMGSYVERIVKDKPEIKKLINKK